MTGFLLGTLGGGRAFLIIALVAWTARLAGLPINDSVGWLASTPAIAIFTLMALVELAYDKSSRAQSRKRPPGLVARVLSAALVGFAVMPAMGWLAAGIAAGLGGAGAFIGTHALHSFRARLGKELGRDLPAALIEDALIIAAALPLLLL
jgi:uncharacterized membrane protein